MRFSFGKALLPVYTVLALIFLLIPIGYTFAFSFNASDKSNIVWRGFTFDNWTTVCQAQGVCESFVNSIVIGVVATALATAIVPLSKGGISKTPMGPFQMMVRALVISVT